MMSKRHDGPFIATIDDNDVVWESAENEAFCSESTGGSGHGRKGEMAVFI